MREPNGRPRPPAILTAATTLFVLFAILLLAGQVAAFLTPPDENAPARPFRAQVEVPGWAQFLMLVAVLLLALMIREGRNGVRVTMTVIVALFSLGAVSIMTDRRPWEDDLAVAVDVATGLVMLALLLPAVILLYLPTSNAYVKHMRQLRMMH